MNSARTAWVSVGGYAERDWADLVALWRAYQFQRVQVIARLPAGALAHRLSIGGGESVTLGCIAEDDVAHQLHHLGQLRERARRVIKCVMLRLPTQRQYRCTGN